MASSEDEGYEYGNIEINVEDEEWELPVYIPEFTTFKNTSKERIENSNKV